MRVARQHQRSALVDEVIEHPAVGGVRDADAQHLVPGPLTPADVLAQRLDRAGQEVEPVPVAMRVVGAEQLDARPSDLDCARRVVEVEPAEVLDEEPLHPW
jgi:hypothetical protein